MEQSLKTTFLPSEVARLVLGYLKEQQCHDAAESFLQASPHLMEYRSMLDQGYTAPLTIGGRSLLELLSLCQLGPASKPTKDQCDLWDKLDHIVGQIKNSSLQLQTNKGQIVKTQAVKPALRIHQRGGLPKKSNSRQFISPPPATTSALHSPGLRQNTNNSNSSSTAAHTQEHSQSLPPHTQEHSQSLPPHTQEHSQSLPPHTQEHSQSLPPHTQDQTGHVSHLYPYQQYIDAVAQGHEPQHSVSQHSDTEVHNTLYIPSSVPATLHQKKRVSFNLPDDMDTSFATEWKEEVTAASVDSVMSYSDIEVTRREADSAPGTVSVTKSPLKGSSTNLRNRRLFVKSASASTNQSESACLSTNQSAAVSTISHIASVNSTSSEVINAERSVTPDPIGTQLATAEAHTPTEMSITDTNTDNQWTNIAGFTSSIHNTSSNSVETVRTEEVTAHSDSIEHYPTLSIPEGQWDWSPFKQQQAPSKEDTPEKDSMIDTEVHDLLNELFPMKTVVQRLVDDTSWTQELANSINRRKEDQSHLAEEKVPEILDLTKNDPNFTDFHALLPDTNKRKKNKPTKKPSTVTTTGPGEDLQPTTATQESNPHISNQTTDTYSITESLPVATATYLPVTAPLSSETITVHLPIVTGTNMAPPKNKAVVKIKKGNVTVKSLFGTGKAATSKAVTSKPVTSKAVTSKAVASKHASHSYIPANREAEGESVSLTDETDGENVQKKPAKAANKKEKKERKKRKQVLAVQEADGPKQITFLPNISSLLPTSNNMTYYRAIPIAPKTSQNLQLTQGSLKAMTSNTTQSVYQQLVSNQRQPEPEPIVIYQTQAAPDAPIIATTIAPVNNVTTSSIVASTQAPSEVTQTQIAGAINRSVAVPVFLSDSDTLASQGLVSSATVQSGVKGQSKGKGQRPGEKPQAQPTPSKDSPSLDLEETTALLFDLADSTPTTGGRKVLPHGKYYTPQAYNAAANKRASTLRPRTQSEGKVPPMAKNQDKCVVTAKWSPSLSKLIENVSPAKRTSRRSSAGHIRHLSFSPKGSVAGRSRKSPFRQSSVLSEEGSPAMNSPQLEIDYPGTPQEDIPSILKSPPSVGGPSMAETPMSTHSKPKRIARLRNTAFSPLTSQRSPTTALRRSPRVNRSPGRSAVGRSPARTAVPSVNRPRVASTVARKGGPSGTRVYTTPSKHGRSPSVVTGEGTAGGTITSVTVAQSTPKGKNSIPTVISSPDLRRAVGAILEQSTEDLLSTLEQSWGDNTRQESSSTVSSSADLSSGSVSSTSDIAAALSGGKSTQSPSTQYDDELEEGEIIENSYDENAVNVAQALMELASSESPLSTPVKFSDDTPPSTHTNQNLMPPPTPPSVSAAAKTASRSAASALLSPRAVGSKKRKASSSITPNKQPENQAKKLRRTPRKMNDKLKKMSVQSMLDLIHNK